MKNNSWKKNKLNFSWAADELRYLEMATTTAESPLSAAALALRKLMAKGKEGLYEEYVNRYRRV